jgi:hypothetical protein
MDSTWFIAYFLTAAEVDKANRRSMMKVHRKNAVCRTDLD